jgi:hypothetical protein
VASLVILFISVTIGLISPIKTHKTMVLPLWMLEIKTQYLLWLHLLIILQMTIGILTLEQVIIWLRMKGTSTILHHTQAQTESQLVVVSIYPFPTLVPTN